LFLAGTAKKSVNNKPLWCICAPNFARSKEKKKAYISQLKFCVRLHSIALWQLFFLGFGN